MPIPRTAIVFAALALAALLSIAAGLLVGNGDLGDPSLLATYLSLRASRVAVAFLAGAALAVGGVLVQGLFRNPLASPSILGTIAGASLGGQLSFMLFGFLVTNGVARVITPEMIITLGSMLGALLSLALLMAVVGRRRDLVVLLLGGFILSSLFLSIGGFLLALAQDSWELGRALVSFALGGVGGSGPKHVAVAVPLVVAGVTAAWLWSRPLDLMLSGQDEAQSLGVDVDALRRWCVVWTAILTAAAVAVGANVGFVGLVVPHALRPLLGIEHRRLVPGAALGGGAFLVCCDVVSRLPGREIPLGVVTGMVGAPLFLLLLLRARRRGTFG